jgi:hypothetical protein
LRKIDRGEKQVLDTDNRDNDPEAASKRLVRTENDPKRNFRVVSSVVSLLSPQTDNRTDNSDNSRQHETTLEAHSRKWGRLT